MVLAVAAAAWFLANQNGPVGPLLLGWVAPPLSLVLGSLALWRTASVPAVPPAAARFWRQIAAVATLSAVGMVVQAAYAIDRSARAALGPAPAKVPIPAGVMYAAAMLFAVWALLRVPADARTRSEWIRLSLDGATAVLGAAVFMWYVGFSPLLTTHQLPAAWAPFAVGVVCLVAFAAIIKIVLAGAGPVDTRALWLLGCALLAGGISAGTATVIANQPFLVPAQVSVPLIAVLVVLAGHRQHRALGVGTTPMPARLGRLATLLPYLAIVATDVLLVLVTTGPVDDRRYAVVGGVITITAIVVARQTVTFTDNARLVDRLRLQEERLREQASHDTLTRLANRALFGERLEEALNSIPTRSELGEPGTLTVLLIDLDDFKTVNDTLGHPVGDRLLAVVADRVRACVRTGDTVARLGGDEFAVLLRDTWPIEVDGLAERVLASVGEPVRVDGYELLVRASIGIAEARPGDGPEALLRNADIAMYAAKEGGKGGYARYVPGMAARILEHARVGAQLHQAVDDGELFLLYQPVVRLCDHRIIGMEALVRWQHPVRGVVPPTEFIPAAERTGLIVPLGRWVLQEACRQKAAWRAAYGELSPATVGVNVSGRQLLEPGFADEVADAVHAAGIEPHNLVLEVTETAVLTGGQALDTLRALETFGVRLALDDFGTGQSSLGLIRTCPVHILKLDKSFVIGGPTDQEAAVATAVAHIAGALGLDAVAEGIETPAQAERLAALGYRLGQGYHLARPLPASEIDDLLAMESLTPLAGQDS
jgi:diguanylate cyclase (GGDEF)-like protein